MHSLSSIFEDVVRVCVFEDVVFDGGVDKISNIPLISKIFEDDDGFGITCI